MTKKLAPMHPGKVLREEFLVPLKLSAGALARKMDVLRTRIERIAEEISPALQCPAGRSSYGRPEETDRLPDAARWTVPHQS